MSITEKPRGFACQWQGPVWVCIYLFHESRQGNHISYGSTVTTELIHRVPSLSLCLCFKTSLSPFILIHEVLGEAFKIFSVPDVSE